MLQVSQTVIVKTVCAKLPTFWHGTQNTHCVIMWNTLAHHHL